MIENTNINAGQGLTDSGSTVVVEQELGADGLPVGVEKDPENIISEPFDPASISIESKIVPMDTLLRRLRQNSIRLAPTFQRNYVWDDTRKSQLIESLMLRIPLPMFYVAANEDGTWDVVDGLQRLTTIRDFLLGEELDEDGKKTVLDAKILTLNKLEFWGDRFNGKSFKKLRNQIENARIVNNILETELRFTVINPGTPEEVKRNIFKRINTGGMPLTQQEIRHALYQGNSSELLAKLVNLPVFKNAVDNSVNDSRMAGRELILRFLAFFIHDQKQYTSDMDKYLSNAMRIINFSSPLPEREKLKIFKDIAFAKIKELNIIDLESFFSIAMKRNHKFFGGFAFRKAIYGMRRTPVNKALFETWSNIFATMSQDNFDLLFDRKATLLDKYKQLLTNSGDFDRSISRDSSSITSANFRYRALYKIIEETLTEETLSRQS